MKEMLVSEWGFPQEKITVLYDRPPGNFFKALSAEERKSFLKYFTESNFFFFFFFFFAHPLSDIKTHNKESIKLLPGSAIVVSPLPSA
jgi:hypothetical protein